MVENRFAQRVSGVLRGIGKGPARLRPLLCSPKSCRLPIGTEKIHQRPAGRLRRLLGEIVSAVDGKAAPSVAHSRQVASGPSISAGMRSAAPQITSSGQAIFFPGARLLVMREVGGAREDAPGRDVEPLRGEARKRGTAARSAGGASGMCGSQTTRPST